MPDTHRNEMIRVGRDIWLRGFCAGCDGNFSVRSGPDRFLCTASGVSKGSLTHETICEVNIDGAPTASTGRYKPSSEILTHLAVYKARPDVKAVIHAHPPHPTAFAITGTPIPRAIHPEVELFLGDVPTVPYASPGSRELADAVAAAIGPETNSFLLANHGTLSFSTRGLTDAYHLLEMLDAYCRVLILAKELGEPIRLTQTQLQSIRALSARLADDHGTT